MKDTGELLEKERLDKSKIRQNLDLYISRTAKLNETITELEEKILILEKRLSNTSSET